jgi:hypothetical protein
LEAEFAKINYRSEFFSQFHPISKKKSAETESGKRNYEHFKFSNFLGFFQKKPRFSAETSWVYFLSFSVMDAGPKSS